jgi:hypothetical protein
MEAEAHPLLQVISDGYRAAVRVNADEVPNQEVPGQGLLAELVHQHPDEERGAREMPVAPVEGGEELSQDLEGGPAVEFVEEVSLQPAPRISSPTARPPWASTVSMATL